MNTFFAFSVIIFFIFSLLYLLFELKKLKGKTEKKGVFLFYFIGLSSSTLAIIVCSLSILATYGYIKDFSLTPKEKESYESSDDTSSNFWNKNPYDLNGVCVC